MPSPIPHVIAGLAVASVIRKRGSRHSTLFYLVAIGFSLLPDLDLVPVYVAGATRAIWHRTFTHSIIFCLFLSWLLSLVPSLNIKFGRGRVFVLSTTLLLCHLALDYFCIDENSPYGIMLLFPFSSRFHMAAVPYLGINCFMDIVITAGLLLVVRAGAWITSRGDYGHHFGDKAPRLVLKALGKRAWHIRPTSEV